MKQNYKKMQTFGSLSAAPKILSKTQRSAKWRASPILHHARLCFKTSDIAFCVSSAVSFRNSAIEFNGSRTDNTETSVIEKGISFSWFESAIRWANLGASGI